MHIKERNTYLRGGGLSLR